MSFVLGFKEWLGNNVWIDDASDRINRKYMVTLIIILMVVVMTGQFIRGDQIQCFTPVYFTGAQVEYSHSTCWTLGTSYIIGDDDQGVDPAASEDVASQGFLNVPISGRDSNGGFHVTGYVGPYHSGQRVAVSYYQWTPLILAIAAFLFHLPYIVWHIMSVSSGMPLESMLSAAREVSKVQKDGGSRDGYINDILFRYRRYIEKTHMDSTGTCPTAIKKLLRCGRSYGNYLFGLYMAVKVLYILLIIVNMLLLQAFFGGDPRFSVLRHGLWVLENLFTLTVWPQSPIFPIKTVCTFSAEQQGNPLPYTLQCVLPLNLYNDKFFAIFTIVYPILLIISFITLVTWLWCNSAHGRKAFVNRYLVKPLDLKRADLSDVQMFTEEYLRRDGIFVLQMIEMNVGGLVVETLIEKLWDQFTEEKEEALRDRDSEGDSVDGKTSLDGESGLYPNLPSEKKPLKKKPSFVRTRVQAGRGQNGNSTMV